MDGGGDRDRVTGLRSGLGDHLAGRKCAEDAVECAHVLGLGIPLERGTSVQPSQREHLWRGAVRVRGRSSGRIARGLG